MQSLYQARPDARPVRTRKIKLLNCIRREDMAMAALSARGTRKEEFDYLDSILGKSRPTTGAVNPSP